MIDIPSVRSSVNQVIVFGNHEPLIQSMLDFDYLSGHKSAGIAGIITGKKGYAKYFWGRGEILIPTFTSINEYSFTNEGVNYWFLNLLSGRRTLSSTVETYNFPFVGGSLFAENVPEKHSLSIIKNNNRLIVGPASVGLIVPGSLKLGPIGGITPEQMIEGKILKSGHVAVLSASGGMTNELINIAITAGHRLSFALSFGGDRFPVLSPRDAFLLAENDPDTEAVIYYGELGGEDEYDLVKLKEEGLLTKQVIAHIAGTVASLFPESPQFGHAKAKADKSRVTATAKRDALRHAGFQVSNSFSEFIGLVGKLAPHQARK